jgi:hypothetical protein
VRSQKLELLHHLISTEGVAGIFWPSAFMATRLTREISTGHYLVTVSRLRDAV